MWVLGTRWKTSASPTKGICTTVRWPGTYVGLTRMNRVRSQETSTWVGSGSSIVISSGRRNGGSTRYRSTKAAAQAAWSTWTTWSSGAASTSATRARRRPSRAWGNMPRAIGEPRRPSAGRMQELRKRRRSRWPNLPVNDGEVRPDGLNGRGGHGGHQPERPSAQTRCGPPV